MRVLIVNPFGIGDVIFTTPIIRAIKNTSRDTFVGYLCNKRTKPVLDRNPYINTTFEYEKDDYRALWKESKIKCLKTFFDFLGEIKRNNFDLVIDLSLAKHYAFLAWFLGIKKRVGFNYKKRGRYLTHKVKLKSYEKKHVVEYYLDLLKLLNITPGNIKLDFFLNHDDQILAL